MFDLQTYNNSQNHNGTESSPYTSGPSTGSSSPVPIQNGSGGCRDSPRGGDSISLNQQTLKQRVNMVVMRMIAQNSDQDQRQSLIPPETPVSRQSSNSIGSGGGGLGGGNVNGSTASSLTHEGREALKMRTLQVSRVIVNARECHQLVDELFRAGQPVGLDGEGVNLGPKG